MARPLRRVMGNTQQALRGIYKDIGKGDLAGLMRLLTADALYERLFTRIVRRGKEAIRDELTGWADYFQGVRIVYLNVEDAQDKVGRTADAVRCYRVQFDILARYVSTPTWMDIAAFSPPGNVRIAFTDQVWLNAEGRIIRIQNSVGTVFLT